MALLIGIIVDAYSDEKKQENSCITRNLLNKIKKEWEEIDQEGKGYIHYR